MPKLKTHRGAKKRFKITGTGKVLRRHAFARHILTKKRPGRKRKLGEGVVVSAADTPTIKRMLPHG
jgi:large subunit ribosomal protein L35